MKHCCGWVCAFRCRTPFFQFLLAASYHRVLGLVRSRLLPQARTEIEGDRRGLATAVTGFNPHRRNHRLSNITPTSSVAFWGSKAPFWTLFDATAVSCVWSSLQQPNPRGREGTLEGSFEAGVTLVCESGVQVRESSGHTRHVLNPAVRRDSSRKANPKNRRGSRAGLRARRHRPPCAMTATKGPAFER